ncbi:MAG: OmpA family protein [Pirellulales bacterium]|nr:OmpA family protein [Pirellulales bacterium]
MRRFASAVWLSAFVLVGSAGCADNSMVLQGQLSQYQQQQLAMARQQQQLQTRAEGLDRDNQELESLLAQARQQTKVAEDQVAALRDQLRGVTTQLAEAREQKKSSDNKVQALTASMRRRGDVLITPNNSLLQTLPTIDLPEVHVRRDGDVIRVELPGSRIFEAGSARLRPEAVQMIAGAAAELQRVYPDQILGVEGHTDSDPVGGTQWRNNHALSVDRAMAVYDVLLSRSRYVEGQLFVVGHGANHPVASNATIEGKRRNRRVELVVYPEKRG